MPSESAFPCRHSWELERSQQVRRNTDSSPIFTLISAAGNSRYLSSVLPSIEIWLILVLMYEKYPGVISNIPRYILYLLFRFISSSFRTRFSLFSPSQFPVYSLCSSHHLVSECDSRVYWFSSSNFCSNSTSSTRLRAIEPPGISRCQFPELFFEHSSNHLFIEGCVDKCLDKNKENVWTSASCFLRMFSPNQPSIKSLIYH